MVNSCCCVAGMSEEAGLKSIIDFWRYYVDLGCNDGAIGLRALVIVYLDQRKALDSGL